MPDPLVLCEVDEKVGIVTLNRPEKLNAISAELQRQLTDAFAQADSDPATSVVLLRAEGRSFCAGYDISAKDPGADDWRNDAAKAHDHLRPQLEFEMLPWLMKKPVIASVQGHVMGGGCELVMLCDLTIAADNATFGEPEVRFSSVGPAIVMPMIIGYKKARELLYFGDTIDARTALDLGMVNRVVRARRAARGEPALREAPVADLPGSALRDKARDQSRRRRRRLPHRALRRSRRRRPALRDQNRIRPEIPRHRRGRGRSRRRQVAIGAVPGITHVAGRCAQRHRSFWDARYSAQLGPHMPRDACALGRRDLAAPNRRQNGGQHLPAILGRAHGVEVDPEALRGSD